MAAFSRRMRGWGVATALLAMAMIPVTQAAAAPAFLDRLPEDEVVYFVLPDRFENGDRANDRGGLEGGRLQTGFDPANKGFYHGGDLKGLIARLDYIEALGATSIWVGTIFKNKAVQGPAGRESAGYHGYWITDFTRVDPHLGTNADFAALVAAAHARGLKVYMDIVVNHTADVIQYQNCGAEICAYRSRADYPYQRRGGVSGKVINRGFVGDAIQTPDNFSRLDDPEYAYKLFVPEAERTLKVPAWLNDPIYYHNRGDSLFRGESSLMGDFVGLDDLMTEHPRVVQGFIDIYGEWIDRYGIDGFRIDTQQHVNPEFWQAFVPAMQARAKAKGVKNFHIFGEVSSDDMDPARLARHTHVDGVPQVLDFAFKRAVLDAVANGGATEGLAKLFFDDPIYAGGELATLRMPTFLSNHDNGRFATYVRKANPRASDAEILDRVKLANAMLLTLRGVPVIYSGDEQGFVGDGNDQDAREDMFASQVRSYNDNRLLGTDATTAVSNFDPGHPLFRQIATLARLRTSVPALTRGRQLVRARGDGPGLFAVSRFDPVTKDEVLIVFNTSTSPVSSQVEVGADSIQFRALAGKCATRVTAPASLKIELPPLGYAICMAVR